MMNINAKRFLWFFTPFVIQISILFFYVIPKRIAIYGSNDDALIASFSVDQSLGVDSDNWIFIKSLLSIPSTYMQKLFPSIGIYGLVLALTIIISISALFPLLSFLNSKYLRYNYLLILSVVTFVFFIVAILNPTYTGAALFSGASGFAIIFFLIRTEVKNPIDLLVLSSVLISLSYLIRAESFLLTLGFFSILILFELLVLKKSFLILHILKVPLIFFAIIFSTNLIFDKVNYSGNDWQEYLALNDLRHSIQLRTAEYALEDHLSEMGWSQHDYIMFKKFSLADPEKLNSSTLKIAVEVSESSRGLQAIASANVKNELIFIKYSYSPLNWLLLLLFFTVIALFVGLAINNLIFLLYLILISFLGLAINYVFAVSYHFPERLTFNVLFMIVTAIFIIAISEGIKLDSILPIYKYISATMTLLLFFVVLQVFPTEYSKRTLGNKDKLENFNLQNKTLAASEEFSVFLGTGSRLMFQWQDPYRSYKNLDPREKIIIIGWHNFSPIWNTLVTEKGLDPTKLHQNVLEQENLRWVDNEGARELLEAFHEQYADGSVAVEDLGQLGNDFYRIFKISEIK